MSFGFPAILWSLLVLVPALVAFFWWSWRTRQRLMTRFIESRLLPNLTSGISPGRRKLRLALLLLAIVCLVLALARPQWGFSWEDVKQQGVDIVVAIDCSKSMLAQDIAPNRLTRAKLAALELMQKARTDRLGLVAFAGSAFLACPLTIDDSAFSQSVESLNVNSVSEGGTALADAIEAALTAYKEEDNQKVLVLFTDGEDHDSGALEAAQKASAAGLRIYTIGVGTPKGELIRVTDAQGKSDYVRDEEGNVVQSHLNEDLLRQIAGASAGGFYLPLQGAKTISTLYEDPGHGLATLRKTEHEEKRVRQYHQRYHWPLAMAIVLLTTEMLVDERRRQRAARAVSKPAAVQQVARAAATLIVMFLTASTFAASPSKALRDYKEGKYDQSLKEYEELLKQKNEDPRLHFNAGTAAYRQRQYEQALRQFDAAANSTDLKLQELSYYNRANSLFWLGEQNQDPKKKAECWEKAIKDYELSQKLNPKDGDAKFNHDFVKQRLEELKKDQEQNQKQNQNQDKIEPSEAARKAKEQADEAVRQRQYAKALDIMNKQLAEDDTTRYYGDFIKRLKEVCGVQETGAR